MSDNQIIAMLFMAAFSSASISIWLNKHFTNSKPSLVRRRLIEAAILKRNAVLRATYESCPMYVMVDSDGYSYVFFASNDDDAVEFVMASARGIMNVTLYPVSRTLGLYTEKSFKR